MSRTPALPFTLNVYNSLSPTFSDFLVQTYPSFFDALFIKYQMIYGFNPHYILKKKFYPEKNFPTSPTTHCTSCSIAHDIQGKYSYLPL